jgi:hypothetical protein
MSMRSRSRACVDTSIAGLPIERRERSRKANEGLCFRANPGPALTNRSANLSGYRSYLASRKVYVIDGYVAVARSVCPPLNRYG